MSISQNISAVKDLFLRECKHMVSRPLYLFGIVVIPLFCMFFFTSLMEQGLPANIPTGAVDMDNSSLSRRILRNMDAMKQTEIVKNYETVSKAREAVQRGETYGFYYIPKRFSHDVLGQRQPKVSFYTNNAYLVSGSLLYKDMKSIAELSSAAVTRKIMFAKGAADDEILKNLQPISIDGHILNNPWLNYSVYLNNIILPGILSLMIFLMTVYVIGVEIKNNTAREWLRRGNHSVVLSLFGKLLPQTILFCIVGIIYQIYLYKILDFPINSGLFPMILAMLFFILASQAFGIFIITMLPTLRMGLSIASLWGMMSFSISGFSFPSIGMLSPIRGISYLFPLRHYYLIYVSQALNGYPMAYAWKYYVFLLSFILMPFLIVKRLKKILIYYKYIP